MNARLAEHTERTDHDQKPIDASFDRVQPFSPTGITPWLLLAGTLVACAPLCLLINPQLLLGGDYSFIQWTVGYVGEYFRHHHCYPNTLNTSGFVGWMMLAFYGFGFFPIVGTISAVTGAALALRITLAALFTCQFWMVYKTFVEFARERTLAFTVATLVSWNIYPMTNLYNRGSVAEVIATAFLTCSCCCLLRLLLLPEPRHRRALSLGIGLCFAAAAITHPITFQFGTLFMLVYVLALLPLLNIKHLLKWALPNVILTAAVVSPWLYIVFTALAAALSAPGDLLIFPNNLDSIWTRLAPFPYDARNLLGVDVGTPFIDAQISVPLLLLCIGMLISNRHAVSQIAAGSKTKKLVAVACCVSFGLFIFTMSISVIPGMARCFGHTFEHLQFAYRTITYINLSLLSLAATLSCLFATSKSSKWVSWKKFTVVACVVIALIGLVIKLNRGAAVSNNQTPEEAMLCGRKDLLTQFDARLTPYNDYVNRTSFGKCPADGALATKLINFPIGTGKNFGRTEPLALDIKRQTLIVTDVAPFPWHHLLLDGKRVAPRTIGTTMRQGSIPVLCLSVPPGSHILEFDFEADKVWALLNVLSRVVFVFWLIATIVPDRKRKLQQLTSA